MSGKVPSSMDMPILLSFGVLWNTLLPRPYVLSSGMPLQVLVEGVWHDTALSIISFMHMLLEHGERMDEHPLVSILVLKTLTLSALHVVPRHTSPMITHPRPRHCPCVSVSCQWLTEGGFWQVKIAANIFTLSSNLCREMTVLDLSRCLFLSSYYLFYV